MIWRRETTLDALNAMGVNTMIAHVGIVFTHLGEQVLEATMPVDERTQQPFGVLHGGASVVLAETLGSVAGYLCTEGKQRVVGMEVNASHLRSARHGIVRGVCRPVRCGRGHQVWQIDIYDADQQHCCTARLTTSILSP